MTTKVERTARHAAMDLLARREHSRQELQRKLGRRYDAEDIQEALGRLSEEGLLSDERFALSFARERVSKGYGPQRIQQELLQRGVSGTIADRAVQELQAQESLDWSRMARDALRKKFGDDRLPQEFAERARRLRFLQYRGFAVDELRGDGV